MTTKNLNDISFGAEFQRKDIIGYITEKKIVYEEEYKYSAIILTTIGLIVAGAGIVMILGYLCTGKKPAQDDYFKQDDSHDQPINQRLNHSVEKDEQNEHKEVMDLEKPNNDI